MLSNTGLDRQINIERDPRRNILYISYQIHNKRWDKLHQIAEDGKSEANVKTAPRINHFNEPVCLSNSRLERLNHAQFMGDLADYLSRIQRSARS